uniref:Uncharacterized protein n=1 Tax=Odontella aurita TaxID=265563 RepID=A0A6U6ES64_9STRA|mmetsp:Transcript_28541/g.84010  ORF Transcript_28541/g.84010 Transcript_28541/m.84010 type:complete len:127 (+) Transcript_28541:191-571(+)|eukprot:CAMPEP_0113585538 /NCGR_PEP_ID=MMETSP0015_2-20120614/33758_1 /TAXON_ID=2838 /ORGANISM="Odontella" /LENGTH=126 /DNA_ID=CAMNT_0000490797 /DNA_START=133 /DNA_END=513 /DNA_ORIENTATION=+ /assembly_acc=CAM_ASM_000160
MLERKPTVAAAAAWRQARPQDCRPRCRPTTAQAGTPKFEGKTEGMNKRIFDIGPGMASEFTENHRELVEYVSGLPKGGHGATKAIKDLQAPTYSPPDYPNFTEDDPSTPIARISMDPAKTEMLKYT